MQINDFKMHFVRNNNFKVSENNFKLGENYSISVKKF